MSPDGRFYWDGYRWVPLERRERGSSVLATATLAAILLAGALWLLNSTELGLSLKCRYLNDVWACLALSVHQVVTDPPVQYQEPVPTRSESPEERARREQEQRISAAAAQVRSAIDDLRASADDIGTQASYMSVAAADVAAALGDVESAHADLENEVDKRPMNAFQQEEVCFALEEVTFARDDVQFEVDIYTSDAESYATAVADHGTYLAALNSATAELRAAAGSDVDWTTLIESASAALADSAVRLADAEEVAGGAASLVGRTTDAAVEQMAKSRRLAATVADC